MILIPITFGFFFLLRIIVMIPSQPAGLQRGPHPGMGYVLFPRARRWRGEPRLWPASSVASALRADGGGYGGASRDGGHRAFPVLVTAIRSPRAPW